ncbi:site-specific integrase [Scandinavium sp.]|uniref:tyrosine-type recombinase/integrase n=1 Tax=Scandinavium sp. TaxID=2830653 RepID=UPI00289909F5|nr:site-specific integrase [Scandinavium sp.]
MGKPTYPTGVENHGGNLRIVFHYKGRRVRESLGVPDTPKNRKMAGELRTAVCFSIKMGNFDYASQFPNSSNLRHFGIKNKEITVSEIAEKWLALKSMDVSNNTMRGYKSVISNMVELIGPRKMISAVSQEDLLFLRRELLTGPHMLMGGQKQPKTGRKATTVNGYMVVTGGMFQFAADNGYVQKNPFDGISLLKKSKADPDPLERDEFSRLIGAALHPQFRNLWSLAVYTGMRHGELCALAWEDIDLKTGTIIVKRTYTRAKEFTLPKTDAGTDRIIHLVQPAIETLKAQAQLTRVNRQRQIVVKLREYGRTSIHPCTFVFNPELTRRGRPGANHYSVPSLHSSWENMTRRAGLRYRNAYQSRHTYACWSLAAGANPTFIANQMGHRNAQMVYMVYGAWMSENNADQLGILNLKMNANAPLVPHAVSGNK